MCPACNEPLQPKLMGMVCEACGLVVSFGEFDEIFSKHLKGGNDATMD